MNRSARGTASRLDEIVRSKRAEVAALAPAGAELRRRAGQAAAARPFEAALHGLGPAAPVALIAEIKRRSPSAGPIRPDLAVAEVARAYQAAGAVALSVLTDGPYFGGALADLEAARAAVSLPVLRKDFVLDGVQLWEARAAGADAVLLIVRILDDGRLRDLRAQAEGLGMGVLVEVHDAHELERALAAGAQVVGVNNRDLATFRTDLAVVLGLASAVPADRLLVAESGIRTPADVDRLSAAGVDAILVGESLMRAGDVSAAAAALAGRPRAPGPGARGAAGAPGAGVADRPAGAPGAGVRAPAARRGGLRVKVCGVCRPEDAALAAAAGADAVGVILSPGFRRSSRPAAAGIFAAAAGCRRVGVFVDAPLAELERAIAELALDVVQLAGEESPGLARALRARGVEVWKVLRVSAPDALPDAARPWAESVDALLLDGGRGGSGERFDWAAVASLRDRLPSGPALIVAGGLTPANVADAVRLLGPDGVDVSSGVEEVVGRKSPAAVRAFVASARAAAGVSLEERES